MFIIIYAITRKENIISGASTFSNNLLLQYISINKTPIKAPIVNLILALLNPDNDIADAINELASATTIIKISSTKFSTVFSEYIMNKIVANTLTIVNKVIKLPSFNIPPVFIITLIKLLNMYFKLFIILFISCVLSPVIPVK